MAYCFTYHSTVAACQGGDGLAELPGLFLAPRTCGESLCMENIVSLGPSRLRPVSPSEWSLLATAYPCTWEACGLDCFAGTMRSPQRGWIQRTHIAKPSEPWCWFGKVSVQAPPQTNFRSRVICGHVSLGMSTGVHSRPHAAKRAAPGFPVTRF